jgi:spermidine synthase
MARAQTGSVKHRLLPPLVFASGAAALAYEVLWVRDWALLYGATAIGTAVVLAAYFAGLALGSWLGGRAASGRDGLRLYAALETVLAAAVLVYVLLRPLLPPTVAWLAHTVPASLLSGAHVLFAFAVLLLPTTLLGAALPAVSAVLSAGDAAGAGRLYAWNTLGGALGALVCGIFAIRTLGVQATFLAAAAIDLLVAGFAFQLGRRPAAGRTRVVRTSATLTVAGRPAAAAIVAAAGGFIGLAAEVLWSRGLSGVLSNSVYSIALTLAAVLIGLVVGTTSALRLMRRSQSIEAHICVAAAALALALCGSIVGLRALPALSTSLIRAFQVSAPLPGFAIEAVLALAVVLTPAMLLGALFRFTLALDGAHVPAGSVGRLLAVNTAAGIVGALSGAFVLLPLVGLGGGLSVLAALAAVVAFWFADRGVLLLFAAAALLVVITNAVVSPPLRLPWREPSPDQILYYRDGATATVSVTADTRGNKRLRINGQYSLGGTQSVLLEAREAHLPLLLHPAPRSLLALGVGTGDTLGAAVAHPGLEVTGVELVGETLDAARLFATENHNLLDSPQVHFVTEDARSFLLRTPQRYDVILADLFLPWTAGTAYLYSRDFYQLGFAHLQPGGMYCQWLPLHQLTVPDLQAIVATFAAVFPHTQLWLAYHRSLTPLAALIGSMSPFTASADTMQQRFTNPRLAAALDAAGLSDAGDLAALYVTDGARLRAATLDVPLITDDRPRLEFSAPAAYFHQQGLGSAAVRWLGAHMDSVSEPLGTSMGGAELRRALLDAQLALLAGERPRELAHYTDALRIAPTLRTVREALVAIARERVAVGDHTTARSIADEVVRLAPETAEARTLATLARGLPR